jgi:transmembrane sensor
MTSASPGTEPRVTADLIAEAAAWIAVLHGPSRTSATERGFSEWLKKSDVHARAFEEATTIWEESSRLPRPRAAFRRRAPRAGSFAWAAVSAAAALLVVALAIFIQWQPAVETRVGEQRVLALDDGSRIILNTDTRVTVAYSRETRRVDLAQGEALFEVAKAPERPFVVFAGDRRIVALGTAFVVRRDSKKLAVTLVEGKVRVLPRDAPAGSPPDAVHTDEVKVLEPGERIVFAEAQPVKLDHPQLEKLLAWQRREVALDDTALAEAVTEMNRYNRKPLEIAFADASDVRVTGLFRAGDSLSFARAVAEAYHLQVIEDADRITLSREARESAH